MRLDLPQHWFDANEYVKDTQGETQAAAHAESEVPIGLRLFQLLPKSKSNPSKAAKLWPAALLLNTTGGGVFWKFRLVELCPTGAVVFR